MYNVEEYVMFFIPYPFEITRIYATVFSMITCMCFFFFT